MKWNDFWLITALLLGLFIHAALWWFITHNIVLTIVGPWIAPITFMLFMLEFNHRRK